MSTNASTAAESQQVDAPHSEHERRDMVNAGMVAIMKFFSKLTKTQRAFMQEQGVEVPIPVPAGILQGLVTPSRSLQELLIAPPATTLTPSLANVQTTDTVDDDVLMTGVEFVGEKMEVDTCTAQGEPAQLPVEEFVDPASDYEN